LPPLPLFGDNKSVNILVEIPVLIPLLVLVLVQVLKLLVSFSQQKSLHFSDLFQTGGIPSGHSAFVSALTTTVFLIEGIYSLLFSLSFCFSLIIIYDAIKLRRNVGLHAKEINHLVGEHRYNERIGHTPFEVIVGIALGTGSALLLFLAGSSTLPL